VELTLGAILVMIIVGAIVGVVARLIVPGRQPMGALATVLLGIAGAVIGGIVGAAINPDNSGPQWILSIIAAVVLVMLYAGMTRRGGRGTL
jgi:uncharacterized membrane protein YeaQ/YmgE (transglycosylase-associated protein family)